MERRYGVLEDSLEEQRKAVEAERQRREKLEEAERQRRAAEAEAERQRLGYKLLTELAEQQRRDKEQPILEQQRLDAEPKQEAINLQAEQQRLAKENEQKRIDAERQRIADAEKKAALELKAEQYWQEIDVQNMNARSLKIRDTQSHEPGRMIADLNGLWEREERRLIDEERRIIEAEPNNIEKLERHYQHVERMQEAVYFPKQPLVLHRQRSCESPSPDDTNRQQAAQRQQAADSPVQTLATQVERQTEETAAPAAAPSKSAQANEREKYLAAFDSTYAQNLHEREHGHGRDGGRELGM